VRASWSSASCHGPWDVICNQPIRDACDAWRVDIVFILFARDSTQNPRTDTEPSLVTLLPVTRARGCQLAVSTDAQSCVSASVTYIPCHPSYGVLDEAAAAIARGKIDTHAARREWEKKFGCSGSKLRFLIPLRSTWFTCQSKCFVSAPQAFTQFLPSAI